MIQAGTENALTEMMLRPTVLDVALFASVATVIAALIGAIGAVAVAWVNAVATRRQARANEHRRYLAECLLPILNYSEMIAKGHEIVHFRIRALEPDWEAAVAGASISFSELTGLGLVMRTPNLKAAWQALKMAEEGLHSLIGEIDRERAARRPLGEVEARHREALVPLRRAVIDFRKEAEKVMF